MLSVKKNESVRTSARYKGDLKNNDYERSQSKRKKRLMMATKKSAKTSMKLKLRRSTELAQTEQHNEATARLNHLRCRSTNTKQSRSPLLRST